MRRIAVAVICTSVLFAVLFGVVAARVDGSPAGAQGGGPDIGFGTVVGNSVTVNALTPATVAYQGFSLQINAQISEGVVLSSITASPGSLPTIPNSVLMVDSDFDGAPDAGSLSCNSGFPPGPPLGAGRVTACTTLPIDNPDPIPDIPPFTTKSTGVLATFSFNATGNGCLQAHLVDLPSNDPAAALYDTFTLNVDNGSAFSQGNNVSAAPVNILIGSGTVDDCPVFLTPTATSTSAPAPTETPTPICGLECVTPTSTSTPVGNPGGGYPAPTGNCVLATQTTAVAGDHIAVVVTVLDVNAEPVVGATVSFSILSQPGTDAAVAPASALTDALGTATSTLAVGSVPGVVQVHAVAPTVSCNGSIVVS